MFYEAELELAALFIITKQMVPLCQNLIEMGWPQPKPALQTEKMTPAGVTNNIIIPKRTKSINMHFHWIRCLDLLNKFCYYWAPRISNLADYSPPPYCTMRQIDTHT